jgi:hypothetical protein
MRINRDLWNTTKFCRFLSGSFLPFTINHHRFPTGRRSEPPTLPPDDARFSDFVTRSRGAKYRGQWQREGIPQGRSGIEAIALAIHGMLLLDPLETIRQTTVLTNRFGMTSWVEFKPT